MNKYPYPERDANYIIGVDVSDNPKHDPVNHPKHYTEHPSGVECIQITEHMNFNLGNTVKYIWRAGLKTTDSMEDLRKARWYLDREIARMTEAPDLAVALDAIDLQLVADSDGVVLPRDAAALVACALHDLLGQPREGGVR